MNSIGLVEVKNVSKGIVVTDEMLKSAGIVLISSGSVCPGKFVTIVGGSIQKLLLIHILNCGKLYFNLILRLTKVLRMQYLFYV